MSPEIDTNQPVKDSAISSDSDAKLEKKLIWHISTSLVNIFYEEVFVVILYCITKN